MIICFKLNIKNDEKVEKVEKYTQILGYNWNKNVCMYIINSLLLTVIYNSKS